MVNFATIRRVVGGRSDTLFGKFFLSIRVYFYLGESDCFFVAGHFRTDHRSELTASVVHPVYLGLPFVLITVAPLLPNVHVLGIELISLLIHSQF